MYIHIWFPVFLDYFGLTAVFLVIFPLQLIWRRKVFSPFLLWTTHIVWLRVARVISDASLDKIRLQSHDG